MDFLSIVKENEEHLAKTLCLDNGKPITQARAEIANLSISVPAFCEKAKHLYDSVVPPGTEKNYERSIQIVKREPLGVIACIIPFNFPSNLFSFVHKLFTNLLLSPNSQPPTPNSQLSQPSPLDPHSIPPPTAPPIFIKLTHTVTFLHSQNPYLL